MSKKASRRPVAEINVVPYIDVMLVLLIIFMITAPLITQGVKVDLPVAQAEAVEVSDAPALVASIDKEGKYYLSVGEDQNTNLSLTELVVLVRAHMEVSPKSQVVVNGDRTVPYGQVVQLMAALNQAGISEVGLLTDPSEIK